jgi:Protein of unknown function (DUF3302)
MNMPSARTSRPECWTTRAAVRLTAALSVAGLVLAAPRSAHASLLSHEAEDNLAWGIAILVLFIVPVVLIVLFWLVHILPEQIAHKRNHPQFEAIRTLCLLSLVFGGLLWPIAWIWAYSKPVLHKLAYGTDKLHEHDADGEHGTPSQGASTAGLHERLARLEASGVSASDLQRLEADLQALETKVANGEAR